MDRNLQDRKQEITDVLDNLRRFAYSLCGNLADADDLMQSTVERVLKRGLPDAAGMLPWCLKVCRNLWIDEIRSRNVRQSAAADAGLAAEQIVMGERQVLGEIELSEISELLAQMPAEQRAVLELVAVEGYAYKEAAETLEIPIGTVMSRLARARAVLVRQ